MVIGRAAERDEQFAENLSRAEDMCLVDPLLRIAGESRKNWRAAVWLIEHQEKNPARRKKAKVAKRRAALARHQAEKERGARRKKAMDAKYRELRAKFRHVVGK